MSKLELTIKVIKQVIEKIGAKIKEFYSIKYYDASFGIKVEKLSVIKEQSKAIDVSQLKFEEEPLLSWEDVIKFSNHKKQKS